jgi:hypothetical protein
MVLFQNGVRQMRSPAKMAATVQLRCYWKQLWSRWAITGSWEPLVLLSPHCDFRCWSQDIEIGFPVATRALTSHVFGIRSISPLPFNLDSPYLDHTLVIGNTCQSGICHLTRCADFVNLYVKFLWLCQFLYYHIGVKPIINFFKVFYKICVFSSLPGHFILRLTFRRLHIFWNVHDSFTFCQNIRPCLKSCSEMPGYGKYLPVL